MVNKVVLCRERVGEHRRGGRANKRGRGGHVGTGGLLQGVAQAAGSPVQRQWGGMHGVLRKLQQQGEAGSSTETMCRVDGDVCTDGVLKKLQQQGEAVSSRLVWGA